MLLYKFIAYFVSLVIRLVWHFKIGAQINKMFDR